MKSLHEEVGDICSFPSSNSASQGRLEDAKQVLGRVYPYATPEQVDLKVIHRTHSDGVIL